MWKYEKMDERKVVKCSKCGKPSRRRYGKLLDMCFNCSQKGKTIIGIGRREVGL